jgi:hypothetical protein
VDGSEDGVQVVVGQRAQRQELDTAVGVLSPGTVGDEHVQVGRETSARR